MKVTATEIPEVMILEPQIFTDHRGFFFESYNKRTFKEVIGVDVDFVQDNHTKSRKNVLRGLHYQVVRPQGKLLRVLTGEIWDVAVDVRRDSPTLGKWVAFPISAESKRMVWIPGGFAHGFLVKSESAEVLYKVTDYYAKQHERTIAWDDPDLAIEWPLSGDPILTEKDKQGASFCQAEKSR
jgi:dTDP-4-dehydrorhamnose 3,5-epimerase